MKGPDGVVQVWGMQYKGGNTDLIVAVDFDSLDLPS